MDNQANDITVGKTRVQKSTKKCPECGEENPFSRKNCRREACQYEFVSTPKPKAKNSYMQHKAVLESQADTLHSEHGFDIAILYWKNQGNGKSLVYRYGTPGNAESFIGSTKLKTSEAGSAVMKLFIDYLSAALQKPVKEEEEALEHDTHPSTGQDNATSPTSSPPTNPVYQQTEDMQTVSQDGTETTPGQASVSGEATCTHSISTSVITSSGTLSADAATSKLTSSSQDEAASPNITYVNVEETEDSVPSTASNERPEPMDTSQTAETHSRTPGDTSSATVLSVVGSAAGATIILESGQVIQISTEKADDAKEIEKDFRSGEEADLVQASRDLVAQALTQAGNTMTTDVPMIACVPTASISMATPGESCKDAEDADTHHDGVIVKNEYANKTTSSTGMAQAAEKQGEKLTEANTREERSKLRQTNNSSSESNWTCHFCRKVFSDNSKLTAHLPTHNKDKPFKCEHCNKSFAQPCSLAKHLTRHSDKPGQMFICEDCGQGFPAYAKLRQHFRVHTGEKPYKCQECGKGFKVASHVVKHQRIHTGERPFVCTECGKAFTESGTLKRHVRTHTGEKPFKCDQCDKAFSQAGSLSMHMHVHLKELMWKSNVSQKTTEIENKNANAPKIDTDQENSTTKTKSEQEENTADTNE